MENKRANFNLGLAMGLSIAVFVFQLTGILVFNAFAQYTKPILLNHLPHDDQLTHVVKFLYVTGITVGFLLQIAPIFLHFDRKITQAK